MNPDSLRADLAERALLASLISAPLHIVNLPLRPDAFADHAHALIYNQIHEMVLEAYDADRLRTAPAYWSVSDPPSADADPVLHNSERRARAIVAQEERRRIWAEQNGSEFQADRLEQAREDLDFIYRNTRAVPAHPRWQSMWVSYLDEPQGQVHVLYVAEEPPTYRDTIRAEQEFGEHPKLIQLVVPHRLALSQQQELQHTVTRETLIQGKPVIPGVDDFDFHRDVIGDDLVVGGMAYSSTEWEADGEGGVRRLSPEASRAVWEAQETALRAEEQQRLLVPGVHADSIAARLAERAPDARELILSLIASSRPTPVRKMNHYAEMVLEAAVRRDLAEEGIATAELADSNPSLARTLGYLVDAVTSLRTATHRVAPVPVTASTLEAARREVEIDVVRDDVEDATNTGDLQTPPRVDRETVGAAEHLLIRHLLTGSSSDVEQMRFRLEPEDFTNPAAARTYRAILVSVDSFSSVDPVLVEWQQRRTEAEHGPGLSGLLLSEMAGAGAPARDEVDDAQAVIGHDVIRRMLRAVAEDVQDAAHSLSMPSLDILRASTRNYTVAAHTVRRVSMGAPEMLDKPIGDRLTQLKAARADLLSAATKQPKHAANVPYEAPDVAVPECVEPPF